MGTQLRAALFTIAKRHIGPNSPAVDEWINNRRYIHTMKEWNIIPL